MFSPLKLATFAFLVMSVALCSADDEPFPLLRNLSVKVNSSEEFEMWKKFMSSHSSHSPTNIFQYNSTISDVLTAWNRSYIEFKKESHLEGSPTSSHIEVFYRIRNRTEGISCPLVTYQMLNYGRTLEGNYTHALSYGPVLGNFTAKSASCASDLVQSDPELSKRLLTSSYANAKQFWLATGFTAGIFSIACTVTITYQGNNEFTWVNTQTCLTANVLTLMAVVALWLERGSSGPIIIENIVYQQITVNNPTVYGNVANTANINNGGVIAGNAAFRFGSGKRAIEDESVLDTVLPLQHGFLPRNLTIREYASANFTHRSMMYYDGSRGGASGPIEFWHQLHPHKEGKIITHFGLHFNSSAEEIHKRQLQRRQTCTTTTETEPLGHYDSIVQTCPVSDTTGSYYGEPAALYYGIDLYGPDQSDAWAWDAGMANVDYNGFVQFMNVVTADMIYNQAWVGCLCNMENGVWFSTGSLQFSWANTYNGYSQCWAANCGQGY